MDSGAKEWILSSNIDIYFWYWYWNIAFSLPNNLSCPFLVTHFNPTQSLVQIFMMASNWLSFSNLSRALRTDERCCQRIPNFQSRQETPRL
jgi:hypothetical protein